ncbi:hypothetical protein D3C87_1830810 [compost metagenome]
MDPVVGFIFGASLSRVDGNVGGIFYLPAHETQGPICDFIRGSDFCFAKVVAAIDSSADDRLVFVRCDLSNIVPSYL